MNKNKGQLAPFSTRALIDPKSIDKEKRTADLVWSTGAKVLRSPWFDDPYFEELDMSAASVRMDRLNSGAPLLNNHGQADLNDVIGVVEAATVNGTEGRSTVRFSKRADVDSIWQDVQDGIIRNVSVGYRVYKYEDVTPPKAAAADTNPTRILRAIDWEPYELSMVCVGADPKASIRADIGTNECEIVLSARSAQTEEESNMSTKTNETVAPVAVVPAPEGVNADAVRKEAVEQERARVIGINEAVRAAKLEQSVAEKLISDGVSVDAARKAVIDALAAKAGTEIRTQVAPGGLDETVTHRSALEETILHRANPSKYKMTERSRQFRGMSLLDLVRRNQEFKGQSTFGLSKNELAARAFMSTSDFPSVLESILNKTLRDQYQAAPRTFMPFCRQGVAPDFKQMSRVQLGDYPSLEKVNENGEFHYGSMSDGTEKYSLATYGKIIAINRQVIINDDLSAFSRVPELIGRAAADLESDIVWAIVTANAALMTDSVALFHATHANLTSSGTVISVPGLGVGRNLMRQQKNFQGRPMNLRPKWLIVPTALETVAQQFTSSAYVPTQANIINPFATGESSLSVIAEPRLDANSITAWYLSADNAQIDTIEYSYLEGQEGVYTETKQGFDVDGMEVKARHDFAAKAIDFRGLYKNVGA